MTPLPSAQQQPAQTFSARSEEAIQRMAAYRNGTILVWGLVVDHVRFLETLHADGIHHDIEPCVRDGVLVLEAHTQDYGYVQTVLFETIARWAHTDSFGVTHLLRIGSSQRLMVALPGWPVPIEIFDPFGDYGHWAQVPPQQGLLERFGHEPFTLGSSAHRVLEHRTLHPTSS